MDDPHGMVFTGGVKLGWGYEDASGDSHTLTHDYVPVGCFALVSGELAAAAPGSPWRQVPGSPWRLVPGSRGPVCLVRFDPGEDPVALLRGAHRLNLLIGLLLLVWAAGAVTAAWTLTAELPPWHYPTKLLEETKD
jgi:hypothetical protein